MACEHRDNPGEREENSAAGSPAGRDTVAQLARDWFDTPGESVPKSGGRLRWVSRFLVRHSDGTADLLPRAVGFRDQQDVKIRPGIQRGHDSQVPERISLGRGPTS